MIWFLIRPGHFQELTLLRKVAHDIYRMIFLDDVVISRFLIIIVTRRSTERGKINLRASQTSSSSSTSYCILASSYYLPCLADFCQDST